MANNFEVLTDSGNLQINDQFKNMYLLRKESFTFTTPLMTPTSAIVWYGSPIPTFDNCSFVAHTGINEYGVSGSAGIIKRTLTNSETGLPETHWFLSVQVTSTPVPASVSVTVYGFGYDTSIVTSTGLEVYDAAGSQVFSSSRKYLKVINYSGIIPTPFGRGSLAGIENLPKHTIPDGKVYAFACSLPFACGTSGASGYYWFIVQELCGGKVDKIAKTIGPCRTVGMVFRLPPGAQGTTAGWFCTYSYFIIDITGM